MDWRMISVCFSVFQFVFMAVIFAVLKFNDMAHLTQDVRELKKEFHSYELKNDERHIKNIESIGAIAKDVANLVGRFDSFNK